MRDKENKTTWSARITPELAESLAKRIVEQGKNEGLSPDEILKKGLTDGIASIVIAASQGPAIDNNKDNT